LQSRSKRVFSSKDAFTRTILARHFANPSRRKEIKTTKPEEFVTKFVSLDHKIARRNRTCKLTLSCKKYYYFLKAHSRVSFQNPMLHCHAHKIAFFIILNSRQFKKNGAELTETEAVFLVMCDPPMNEL
jgi:hypothetical protein